MRTVPPPSTSSRSNPTPPELAEKAPPIEHGPGTDDTGERTQGAVGPAKRTVHGENQLLAPAVPKSEIGIQFDGPGDRDLQRMLGLPGRKTPSTTQRTRCEQTGVVPAQGIGADEDGIGVGALAINPIQVGPVGEYEPIAGGVVEAAIDGNGRRQQDVRTDGHGQRERW